MKPIWKIKNQDKLYSINPVPKITALISKFWDVSVAPKEDATEKKIYKEMKEMELPNDENASDLGLIQKLSKPFNDKNHFNNSPLENMVYACVQYGEHLQAKLSESEFEKKVQRKEEFFSDVKNALITLLESDDEEQRKEAIKHMKSESFTLKGLGL